MEQHIASDVRTKRKQPPTSPPSDRPMKQLKPVRGDAPAPGTNNGPEMLVGNGVLNGVDMLDYNGIDVDDDDGRSLGHVAAAADSVEWQATIERVVKNVVSIHFCQTHSFDTDSAVASEATGFVVDAERGYILTNRVLSLFLRWGN